MGLVALTVAFATLGVYVARDWGGASWFIAWLLSLGCLIGLKSPTPRQHGPGARAPVRLRLLIGASVATTVDYYATDRPEALRQAFAATALFVGALGLRRLRDPQGPLVPVPVPVLAAAGAAASRGSC